MAVKRVRLLLCLGVGVLAAGCTTTSTRGTYVGPPTTSTTTTAPVLPSTTTTIDIPQMTLPPATTSTTAAAKMCSLTVLRAEAYPTCQQTYGENCTTQQVEDIGRRNYGCQEFGP